MERLTDFACAAIEDLTLNGPMIGVTFRW